MTNLGSTGEKSRALVKSRELSTRHLCSTPTGHFLNELFSQLDQAGVCYCVLRGYEGLPDVLSHDVDLFVEQEHVYLCNQILQAISLSHGWQLVRCAKRFGFHSHYLVRDQGGGFCLLPIDVWTQISWKAVPYADKRVVLGTRRRYRGLWVASWGSEAAISLLKECLQFGRVKDRDNGQTKKRLVQLARQDPLNFAATVEPRLSRAVTQFLLQGAQNAEWLRLERRAEEIRRLLIVRSIQQRPIAQVLDWIRFIWGHFSDKVLQPSGLFVCLIGPDGSGKTTVSRRLERDLGELFGGVSYYHGHLGVLPELKRYYALVRKAVRRQGQITPLRGETGNGIASQSCSSFRALIYVFYYFLDYFLGHFVIRRAKAWGELLLFDRYFYDYMIQPTSRRVPRWLLWALERLLPKPDVLIWLRNEPEVIHSRKPELDVAELRVQMEICEEIVKRVRGGRIVIADTPGTTVRRVSKIVLDKMADNARWV